MTKGSDLPLPALSFPECQCTSGLRNPLVDLLFPPQKTQQCLVFQMQFIEVCPSGAEESILPREISQRKLSKITRRRPRLDRVRIVRPQTRSACLLSPPAGTGSGIPVLPQTRSACLLSPPAGTGSGIPVLPQTRSACLLSLPVCCLRLSAVSACWDGNTAKLIPLQGSKELHNRFRGSCLHSWQDLCGLNR